VGVPDPSVQVRVGLVSVEHVVLTHPHHQVARRDVLNQRLKMISKHLFGLHVHSRTDWLRPRNSPLPLAFELIYEGASGQPR
jgi:hypothetical protein